MAKETEVYVQIALDDMPEDMRTSMLELIEKYAAVSHLVGKLIKLYQERRKIFVIQGFDWTVSSRKKVLNRSDMGDTNRTELDHSYSWRPSLFVSRPIALKELHRAFSLPHSSTGTSSFTESHSDLRVTTSEDADVEEPGPAEGVMVVAHHKQGPVKKTGSNKRKRMRRKARIVSPYTRLRIQFSELLKKRMLKQAR
ncbi:unnamed protein product [Echinostoma caproni]|uniref:CACTA en-spm transposon protein n=1 Tax=Echinostoma caproni TaxID=27848 RepID=A0A183ADM4_9TREM|nr:unnamed protein product [Echinostoma caproni]